MDSPGSRSSHSRSRSSSPGSHKSRSPVASPRSASSRSRSGSKSASAASKSRSRSNSSIAGSSARSRSRSGSRSSSPRFVSATPSGSDSHVGKKSGSASSASAASSNSSKGKRRLKAKERKVSSQLAAKMDDNSDDEEDKKTNSRKKEQRSKEKQTAKGIKKDANKKSHQKVTHEASEEGEVSSEDKEFDDGLDEDLMGNEEDRDYLEGLTEKEREEELFKRAENREQLKKRFEIQKKLRIQQKLKGTLTPKKRKSISDDEETTAVPHEAEKEKAESGEASDSNDEGFSNVADAKVRAQDRQNKIYSMRYDKKSSALSELKAKRQERERKDQERKEKKELENRDSEGKESSSGEGDYTTGKRKNFRKERSRSMSSSSSRSGGSRRRRSRSSSSSSISSKRSGSASPKRRKSLSPRVQEYIEKLEDLEPIRLSRFKLERFVHLPLFKRLVVGCFVRIGIGSDPATGRPVYRCSEIADVVETAKIYVIGKARTNAGLKLKFGQQERVFRLEFISNSAWTPQEFVKWKLTCEEANMALPSLHFVRTKTAEIKKAMSYEYTSEDVDKIVAQKERFHKHPVNYAMYKARLLKEKDLAMAEGDETKSGELETKLNEIEERAEELDRRRTHTISSVALINDRNRKANVSKAEEAIRLEMRREKTEGKVQNPFKRRKCNPRMVTKVSENDGEQVLLKEEKENQELKRKAGQIAPPSASKDSGKQTKKNDSEGDNHINGAGKEDLFDAHNFDIEIDVDTNVVAANPVNVNLKPVNLATKDVGLSKRSLNLDDYKKKRGLI